MSIQTALPVERLPIRCEGQDEWVITRFFAPGGQQRVRRVMERVRRLPAAQVKRTLAAVMASFAGRHESLEAAFQTHYEAAAEMLDEPPPLSRARRMLAGAYFTMEYSFASTALFNPSIAPHPDQRGLPAGALRFILSFRATGEGHVSSIIFRTGVIAEDGSVSIERPAPDSPYRPARPAPDQYYLKPLFRRKLMEMGVRMPTADMILEGLPQRFTLVELERAADRVRLLRPDAPQLAATIDTMCWLARENYTLELPADADISQVVVFPQSGNESHGIEDLRMVRFVDDDGAVVYYGTYSASNGFRVLPQLMETRDLRTIQVHTLNGAAVQDKGMALFPRRIDGHYVMCSRIDGENLYIMYSDIVEFWESAELLERPRQPWELMQIGNCGSPLETPAGWLLLTHGVGPMRTYCVGALLLDRDDPTKVLGRLDQPLLAPEEEEREGYTPNVVYSCGALIHNDRLYLPYAVSDKASRFAVVPLDDLLERLL